MSGEEGNGRPPVWWHALDTHRDQEAQARHALDAKHDARERAIEVRVDLVESWVDQLKGAQGLLKALIGTNILVAVATVIALVVTLQNG